MNLKELNFLNSKTRRKIAAGAISVAMGFSIVAPNISAVANVIGIHVSTVKAFADEVNSLDIRKVVSDFDSTFFIMNDGSVYVRGDNSYGQLGLGDTNDRTAIVKLNIGSVKDVVISNNWGENISTFFLTEDGSIYVCGDNTYGQLGTGDTKSKTTPTKLNIESVKDVVIDNGSTFFMMEDGSVYACGLNDSGQLGTGDTASKTTPTKLNIGSVKDVVISNNSGGNISTFFLTEDGSVYVCGDNTYGQLGTDDTNSKTTPIKVDIEAVKNIITNGFSTFFIMEDGSIYVCGSNTYGQLGTGDTTKKVIPVKFSIDGVKNMFTNNGSYYFLMEDGSVYVCGNNYDGALGIGGTSDVIGLKKLSIGAVKDIYAGDIIGVYFLMESGDVMACGNNGSYNLGFSDSNPKTVAKSLGLSGIKKIVGYYAISDNAVYQLGHQNTKAGIVKWDIKDAKDIIIGSPSKFISTGGNIFYTWKNYKYGSPIGNPTKVNPSYIRFGTTYTVDKIYNADDQSKYGSWFNGFYSKSLFDKQFLQFILNTTDGTGTLNSGGVIDESQIRDKYFLSDGSVILIDNYGMVQYYKDLTTTEPSTLPIDGSGIIGADTLIFGTGTSAVKHPVLYFGSSSKYIDTDGSLKTFTLKKNDISKMFAYKYAKGMSQYMLIQKSDGSLVYLDADGHQQDFGQNMNDVSYIMPATGVNKDIFVMKDGTLRDDKGVIALPDGLTLKKVWSNRFFEMSDGMLYTFQNGTFKNTNTLASFAKLAQNNALLLKNGNFQLADATGNLTNDLDVAGADVKYMSQLDSTNMYLILNDGTTYGVGDKVQGDSLENHGININDVSAFLSNGSDNVVRALVTKDGTVYTNPSSWAKNTMVHFSSDAVNSSHDTNPVYTNPRDAAGSGDPNKLPGGTDEKGDGINPTVPTDTTGPVLDVTGNPDTWTNKDITLSVSASDEEGGSGFAKIVLPDNSEITTATGTFKVTQNGTYTFKAQDNDGNETTQTVTVNKIDKTAPETPSISNDGSTVTITAGTDADSKVKETDYSIDGGAYQKYTEPFTLEAGSHTVKAKTIDNAGNESAEASKNVTVEDSNTNLQEATEAVENAENTKKQEDVDSARDIVDTLPDSPEKQELEDRLDAVQDEIDKTKEDEQKLKDATDAVDHAEDTGNQDDLDHAKDLVDDLPDGPAKDELEDRIKDIQDEIDQENQEAQDLADAIAAVEKAEQTKTKGDYDTAVGKVSALKDGDDKTGLQGRLDKVKSDVDALIKAAGDAVTKAELTKTDEDINAAQGVIDKVPDGWDVSDLQNRLDNIKKEVGDQNLVAAKAAVEKAESTQLQEDVDSARVLVNKLPSGQDKTDLSRRLDAVQDIINLYKNAEQRVQTAEKLKTEYAVSNARSIVSKLPDGDKKDSLNSRLDAVEAAIALNNTIEAIDKDITALEKDVDSHIKYNTTMDIESYRSKITALRDRVTTLPDNVSDAKSGFNERLDTIDSKLTTQKDVQDAIKKVEDALNKANETLDDKDIQDAQNAIDDLPDGVNKSKYQDQLDIIKQKKQAKVAKNTTDANRAVTKASRSRLQIDIDAARTLVNALPDGNNKTQLSKQLDLIQKYVRK